MAFSYLKLKRAGFTLIELSIVLVIIGLIVGGVLVGQDLIKSAEIKSQISQIKKYNVAVNTFVGKYGYLPGDMPNPYAGKFGFQTRGQYRGEGDGNGILESVGSSWAPLGSCSFGGEVTVFWVDLSTAGLLDGTFNTSNPTLGEYGGSTSTGISSYLPTAKIGNGNLINIWSYNAINYYAIANVMQLSSSGILANAALRVAQAYAIDKKMDDGLPQTGEVMARAIMYTTPSDPYNWSGNGAINPWANGDNGAAPGTPAAASAITCYDNNNAANPMQYSVGQNGGAGVNCALSLQLQ